MSKKSYKQLQNRLYREIKRRIIAEQHKVYRTYPAINQFDIDTFKIACIVPQRELSLDGMAKYVKEDLVIKLAKELHESGHIQFSIQDEPYSDIELKRIEAWCYVAKKKESFLKTRHEKIAH